MVRPELENMSTEELSELIERAKRLLAEKVKNPGEWADKIRSLEDDAAVERQADPFRSPTA